MLPACQNIEKGKMLIKYMIFGIFMCAWFLPRLVAAIKENDGPGAYTVCGTGLLCACVVFGPWIRSARVFTLRRFWLFYISIGLAAVSAFTLRKNGGPSRGRGHAAGFTDTGIYGFVRHPVFLSGILAATGIMLFFPPKFFMAPCAAIIYFFVMAARKEDERSVKKFGGDYEAYMKRVPALNIFGGSIRKIIFFQPLKGKCGPEQDMRRERYLTVLAGISAAAFILFLVLRFKWKFVFLMVSVCFFYFFIHSGVDLINFWKLKRFRVFHRCFARNNCQVKG